MLIPYLVKEERWKERMNALKKQVIEIMMRALVIFLSHLYLMQIFFFL